MAPKEAKGGQRKPKDSQKARKRRPKATKRSQKEGFALVLTASRLSFIQALRAFRRAEIVFDVVLFESCVGGVAVAMTVASIFYFEFWFLWGVR